MPSSSLSTNQQLSSLWKLGGLTWAEFARRLWKGMNDDQLFDRAYELAYNFLLASFPLLFFLLALLGTLASVASKLRGNLFVLLQAALPPQAYSLMMRTLNEVTHHTLTDKLTFGLLFTLIVGSAGMTQLISTLNAAYGVREGRSWLRVHLISLGLTAGVSFLVILGLVLGLAGTAILHYVGTATGWISVTDVAAQVLRWVLAIGFVVIGFAAIFYFGPDVYEQHWYWITPGSVTGVLLWSAASAGLRAYLYFFNSYSRVYGSLGGVIILMLWFYITGVALLMGGQINATIEHAAAEHGHPEAKAEGRKAA